MDEIRDDNYKERAVTWRRDHNAASWVMETTRDPQTPLHRAIAALLQRAIPATTEFGSVSFIALTISNDDEVVAREATLEEALTLLSRHEDARRVDAYLDIAAIDEGATITIPRGAALTISGSTRAPHLDVTLTLEIDLFSPERDNRANAVANGPRLAQVLRALEDTIAPRNTWIDSEHGTAHLQPYGYVL